MDIIISDIIFFNHFHPSKAIKPLSYRDLQGVKENLNTLVRRCKEKGAEFMRPENCD